MQHNAEEIWEMFSEKIRQYDGHFASNKWSFYVCYYTEENSVTETTRLERVIGILVNLYILEGIMTKIPSYPRQGTRWNV